LFSNFTYLGIVILRFCFAKLVCDKQCLLTQVRKKTTTNIGSRRITIYNCNCNVKKENFFKAIVLFCFPIFIREIHFEILLRKDHLRLRFAILSCCHSVLKSFFAIFPYLRCRFSSIFCFALFLRDSISQFLFKNKWMFFSAGFDNTFKCSPTYVE
jgi:hypothetical protein